MTRQGQTRPGAGMHTGQDHRLPPGKGPQPGQAGFTLIEILTVLVIAGLLMGFVAPGVQKMFKTIERQSIRQQLIGAIVELPYRAWVEGKSRSIGGKEADRVEMPIQPPWALEIAEPIRYAYNGICSGGELVLIDPDGIRESYKLESPRCDRLIPLAP